MKGVEGKAKEGPLSDARKKVGRYLRALPPGVLEVQETEPVEILEMTPGAYNLNFHVRVNTREFVFRINIEQQSGLSHQVEYEFMVLKLLESHAIGPKPYHFDNKRDYFDFGILIEEYLEGSHLSLERGEIDEVAELLARLHSLELRDVPLVVWRDPLVDTYALVRSDLAGYEARGTSQRKIVRLSKDLLDRVEPLLARYRKMFDARSLNHTDVVCDNFVRTPDGLRLIDWEKPRVDDSSYDICCFLSEAAQLWCSRRVLAPTERDRFLQVYAKLSGQRENDLREKVAIREPLVSLHWILWGAMRLCDFRDRRTAPELLTAHEERAERYERIAHPENIEKLLDRQ